MIYLRNNFTFVVWKNLQRVENSRYLGSNGSQFTAPACASVQLLQGLSYLTFHDVLDDLYTPVIMVHMQNRLRLKIGRQQTFSLMCYGMTCDQTTRSYMFEVNNKKRMYAYAICIVGALLQIRLASLLILVETDLLPSSDSSKFHRKPIIFYFSKKISKASSPSCILRTLGWKKHRAKYVHLSPDACSNSESLPNQRWSTCFQSEQKYFPVEAFLLYHRGS